MKLCEKCKDFIAEDNIEAKSLKLSGNLTEKEKKDLEGSKNWLCHKCLKELIEKDINELFTKIGKTEKGFEPNEEGQFADPEAHNIMGYILALQGVIDMLNDKEYQSSNRKELRDIILGKLDTGESISWH